METKIKIEKFRVYEVNELIESGYKIGRLSSNRKFDKPTVSAKKRSLKTKGLLQPAIVIYAEMAINEGLNVIDFETMENISESEQDTYLVLVDANHRYKAHLDLSKDKDYNGKFYMMLPLTDSIKVAEMLAEMNICTRVWKGTDYIRGAFMTRPAEATKLLKEMMKLEEKGFSLPAISKYLTGTDKVNNTVLTKFMSGENPDILMDSDTSDYYIERSIKIIEAASKFDTKFLASRTFPDWINSIREPKLNDEELTDKIVRFLQSLTKDETDDICNSKGEKGGDNRETIINNKLNSLYKNYCIKQIQKKE